MLALIALYVLGPPTQWSAEGPDHEEIERFARLLADLDQKRITDPGVRADRPRMRAESSEVAGEGEGRLADA